MFSAIELLVFRVVLSCCRRRYRHVWTGPERLRRSFSDVPRAGAGRSFVVVTGKYRRGAGRVASCRQRGIRTKRTSPLAGQPQAGRTANCASGLCLPTRPYPLSPDLTSWWVCRALCRGCTITGGVERVNLWCCIDQVVRALHHPRSDAGGRAYGGGHPSFPAANRGTLRSG